MRTAAATTMAMTTMSFVKCCTLVFPIVIKLSDNKSFELLPEMYTKKETTKK